MGIKKKILALLEDVEKELKKQTALAAVLERENVHLREQNTELFNRLMARSPMEFLRLQEINKLPGTEADPTDRTFLAQEEVIGSIVEGE